MIPMIYRVLELRVLLSKGLENHQTLAQNLNPKGCEGGLYVPMAQEITRNFSQDHSRVLIHLDFFKNDVWPRSKRVILHIS